MFWRSRPTSAGTSGTSVDLAILIDTQTIVWAVAGSPKLSVAAHAAITSGAEDVHVSAVTAFEFVDLNRRGRFGVDLPFRSMLEQLEATILDYPAQAWTIAEELPAIHYDAVDRMLIAHAIHADLTLVTADSLVRRYPVRTLW